MIKVIETNISLGEYKEYNEIEDFQSRVIEVDNWESYVEEIKNLHTIHRHSCIGSLHGNSVPRNCRLENFESNDFQINCIIINFVGHRTQKLIYKV